MQFGPAASAVFLQRLLSLGQRQSKCERSVNDEWLEAMPAYAKPPLGGQLPDGGRELIQRVDTQASQGRILVVGPSLTSNK